MDEKKIRKISFFNNYMTTNEFVYALGEYNNEILDRIYDGEDFSDLLEDFELSNVADNPKFKEAYEVFNITQPEIYFANTGINVTSEVYRYIRHFNHEDDREFVYRGLKDLEKTQERVYASIMKDYHIDEELDDDMDDDEDPEYLRSYFDKHPLIVEMVKAPSFMRSYQEELDRRANEYLKMCKKWKEIKYFVNNSKTMDDYYRDFREESMNEIHDQLYYGIRRLMKKRARFVPRYILDYDCKTDKDGNITYSPNESIESVVAGLDSLDTFAERYDYLFGKNAPSFKQGTGDERYTIKPVVKSGGSITKYVEKTLKAPKSELHKKYKSKKEKFLLSDVSRNFVIVLFFYLSLPADAFEDFLKFHGYAITEELPLIWGSASIDKRSNKQYTEKANIFYKDIKAIMNHGVSYNTIITFLFGENPVRLITEY